MRSNGLPNRDEVLGRVEDFRAAAAALASLPPAALDALNFPDLAAVLDTTEAVRRQTPVIEHAALNALITAATPEQVGGSLKRYLADRLRIDPAEAHRRIADAELLGPRRTLTGEPLPPVWAGTAAGQRAGTINNDHVREIARFFHKLPGWVEYDAREAAEATLARHAATMRPDELRAIADTLANCLNPDGNFTDEDRARARGITLGRQDIDGTTPIKGRLTPEAAAGLHAVFGKWAAPGMCDPNDQTPITDGEPTDAAKEADTRSTPMRNHDALVAITRSVLSSGELGSHRGLPVSIVVTTTLQELQSAAGIAESGPVTLPMPDVIRMASHARHYLRIYDKHTSRELYLGETKRIATPAQRIVLHAKDRGCTRPGCTAPGYLCEVHHVDEWAHDGPTDIDNLTFVCGPDHKLLDKEGWKTRKNKDGTTEWIPPPQLDFGKPRTNGYWHPQRYFTKDDDEDDGEKRET